MSKIIDCFSFSNNNLKKTYKKIRFVNSKQTGPDHKKQYLVELYIDNIKMSESWGETIKSAEQRSSKIAIKAVI